MTTRRQILLLVMPLFAGLALLGGALLAWLQIRAADRDFRTEVETAAIAIAELVRPEDLEGLADGQPLHEDNLGANFTRILRWRQVERIFILDDTGRLLADTLQGEPMDPSLLELHPPAGSAALGVIANRGEGAPVRPAVIGSRKPGVRLGIEVAAESHLARREAIWTSVAIMSVVTLATGLVVSLALAAFVSWQFRGLSRLAGLVGKPGFEGNDQDSLIQEVSDVGSILAVMHSVLIETLDRTRRSLADREFVRSDHVHAQVLRDLTAPTAGWSCASVTGAFIHVGQPISINGTLEIGPDTGAAFLGLLPLDTSLEAAVGARAATDYFTTALRHLPLQTAAEQTWALFRFRELIAIRWAGDRLEEWRRSGAADAVSGASTLSAERPVVYSTIDTADRARLAVYLRTYPEVPLARLISDLPVVLAGNTPGAILVLQRATPAP